MKNLIILCASAALLTACASNPYVPTVFNPDQQKVETLAVVDVDMPEKLGANELTSHVGTAQAAGGLLGVLVAGAMEAAETSNRKGSLDEKMAGIDIDYEAEFEAMLMKKIAAKGYKDVSITLAERKKDKLLNIEKTADAYLDIDVQSFGLQKAKTGTEWRPAMGTKVRLLSSNDQSLLMENYISYNSGVISELRGGHITVEPDTSSTGFMKIKDVEPDIVNKDIMAMMDEVTTIIASLIDA